MYAGLALIVFASCMLVRLILAQLNIVQLDGDITGILYVAAGLYVLLRGFRLVRDSGLRLQFPSEEDARPVNRPTSQQT